MGRPRKSREIVYVVEVTPEAYTILAAMSQASHRPPSDIVSMAIHLFSVATRNINMMHLPKNTAKPLPISEQNKRVQQARAQCAEPVSLGHILNQALKAERNKS